MKKILFILLFAPLFVFGQINPETRPEIDPNDTLNVYVIHNGAIYKIGLDSLKNWVNQANPGSQTLSFTDPNLSISGGNSVDLSSLDTDTQLNQEQVEDFAGALFNSNTDTRITSTYNDGTGKVDLVVDPSLSNYTNDAGLLTTVNYSDITANSLDSIRHANKLPYPYIRVLIIAGQSNANGNGVNTDLTAGQLAAQTKFFIWNNLASTPAFEALDIGTNNKGSSNPSLASNGEHGIEAGLINHFHKFFPGDSLYILKHAWDGTAITEHITGGTIHPQIRDTTIYPGLQALINQGRIPYVSLFWSQGESDMNATNKVLFDTRFDTLRNEFRTLLGEDLPIIANIPRSTNADDDEIKDTYRKRATEDPYFDIVDSESYPGYDGSHFTTSSLDSIARDFLKALVNLPVTGTAYNQTTVPPVYDADVSDNTNFDSGGGAADGDGIYSSNGGSLSADETVSLSGNDLIFDGDNDSRLITASDLTTNPAFEVEINEPFSTTVPALEINNSNNGGMVFRANLGGDFLFGFGGSGIGITSNLSAISVSSKLPSGSEAFGFRAGNIGTVTGVNNTSFGGSVGDRYTSAYGNTVMGSGAAAAETTGYNDVIIGVNALATSIGSNRSMVMGGNAMRLVDFSEKTIGIGSQVFENGDTITNSILIGDQVAGLYTGRLDSILMIGIGTDGASPGAGTNLPLIYGSFETRSMLFSATGGLKIRDTAGTPSYATTDVILDLESTTKAFLPPRMTTTQRDALTATAGMVIYNTTTNKHQGYNGTSWNDFY